MSARMGMTRAGAVCACWVALAVTGALAFGCSRGQPASREERLAHGRQILQRMSDALASTDAISVATHETMRRVTATGEAQNEHLTRETVMRRPNRLYFKTSGDRSSEAWYDGAGLTIALHGERVFGQASMPETVDRLLDTLRDRYG